MSKQYTARRVVVTGIGAVSPIGNNIAQVRDKLYKGVNGISTITRFDTSDLKASVAGQVVDYDPLLYMEKSEARKYDLYAQFALGAAVQAVEDSGIDGQIASERFGVYVGSGIGGMNTFMEECHKLETIGPRRVSPFFVPMMIANMAAGLIAIRYKAKGPCLPIVTACATGTHSIGEAFRAISHGHADAIISGSAEAAITRLAMAGFGNAMALTTNQDPDTACRPFDMNRDGFVMGEGAAMLVLEEYEHAKARGAKIYAEIIGYGNTCDAHHVTAPDPTGETPAAAIRAAATEAGLIDDNGNALCDLNRVYVNAHGTSTPLNDKSETGAYKQAFGKGAYDLHISSTKSMTGHMLGAAGAMEAVICVLSLTDGIIPPTINYQEADPDCDLNYTPNKAVTQELDYAISSSLGFGGHNAVIAMRKCKEE